MHNHLTSITHLTVDFTDMEKASDNALAKKEATTDGVMALSESKRVHAVSFQ